MYGAAQWFCASLNDGFAFGSTGKPRTTAKIFAADPLSTASDGENVPSGFPSSAFFLLNNQLIVAPM